MDRRCFLVSSFFLGAGTLLGGCGVFSSKNRKLFTDSPDISLDENNLKEPLSNSFSKVRKLIEGDKDELIIEFPEGSGRDQIRVTFSKNNDLEYSHVKLEKTNSESVFLSWGREGLFPSLDFLKMDGSIAEKEGKNLSFSFGKLVDNLEEESSFDFLKAGLKLAALGLAFWIGAEVAGAVISAIAFIAYTAFLLGSLLIVADVSLSILEWVLRVSNIDKKKVLSFFEKIVLDLSRFIEEVLEFLKSNYEFR
ncbi:MAG: hypothetical protein ABEI53_01655 [Candidatus Magasanikbacteria bacterium]